MGTLLQDADEYTHPIGTASNWNESRYIDFWDARARVGGWFRIGNRPNERHAEMSACINLPDGKTAFMFSRPTITGNALEAAGQQWQIDSPWDATRVSLSRRDDRAGRCVAARRSEAGVRQHRRACRRRSISPRMRAVSSP